MATIALVALGVTGSVALGTALAGGPVTTNIPPEKQALENQMSAWQAQAAASANASQKLSDPGQPLSQNAPETWSNGVIGNEGAPWAAIDFVETNVWQGWIAGRRVSIYAGSTGSAPNAGVLMYVVQADGNLPAATTIIAPPIVAGPLDIIGAQGSTLQLSDPKENRFTFDGLAMAWSAP